MLREEDKTTQESSREMYWNAFHFEAMHWRMLIILAALTRQLIGGDPEGNHDCTSSSLLMKSSPNFGHSHDPARSRKHSLWYKFEGDGFPLTVDSCWDSRAGFQDTDILAYQGPCDELRKVDGIRKSSCPSGTIGSHLTFQTATGQDYFILIQTKDRSDAFEIQFHAYSGGNDDCPSAEPVSVPSPEIWTSAIGARPIGVQPCVSEKNSTSRGVWFSFIGSGELTRVSADVLYTSEFTKSDLPLEIEVLAFKGNCSSLSCLAEGRGQVDIFGDKDVQYRVFVAPLHKVILSFVVKFHPVPVQVS